MDMNTHNKVALKFFADDEEFNVERATLKELASSPYIAKVRLEDAPDAFYRDGPKQDF